MDRNKQLYFEELLFRIAELRKDGYEVYWRPDLYPKDLILFSPFNLKILERLKGLSITEISIRIKRMTITFAYPSNLFLDPILDVLEADKSRNIRKINMTSYYSSQVFFGRFRTNDSELAEEIVERASNKFSRENNFALSKISSRIYEIDFRIEEKETVVEFFKLIRDLILEKRQLKNG